MSHRGESSLGSIFIYLRFVVFLVAEMTLISRSRLVETLKAKTFILKDGRTMERGGGREEDGGSG